MKEAWEAGAARRAERDRAADARRAREGAGAIPANYRDLITEWVESVRAHTDDPMTIELTDAVEAIIISLFEDALKAGAADTNPE